ncbi:MAG: DUF4194 domain-containing protein [Ktedonobacteraceae bacterium]|nr:DUF4194 domain-containing protein [Ktedonobacteraceae bacterium]
MRSSMVEPFAPVIIKLLQGPLYSDDNSWNLLLSHIEAVRRYCAQIGLELRLHEEDGFAYLRQPALEDDEGKPVELPRLTRRVALSYHVSLLCVFLREQLLLFESSNLENTACILTREKIYDVLQPYLRERTNEMLMKRQVDELIEAVVRLGFLKKRLDLGEDSFEIRRLLKAKFDAEKLNELKERLKMHGSTEQ